MTGELVALYISDNINAAQKKPGTLKWESDWKVIFKNITTGNA